LALGASLANQGCGGLAVLPASFHAPGWEGT
jgi:hypothetical protein